MLRVVIFYFVLIQITSAYSQNADDALRYSFLGVEGTARTMGMGGAFSSIGADAGGMMNNPAGLGMSKRSEMNFGFQLRNVGIKTAYLDVSSKGSNTNFNIPNINLIIAGIQYDANGKAKKKGITAINFALNINRSNSFNGKVVYSGQNTGSSITDFLAARATAENSNPLTLSTGTLAGLAYKANLIDFNSASSNNQYISGYFHNSRNNKQTGSIIYGGNQYDYQFTGGINFSNKIAAGLGLCYSSLKFTRNFVMNETDNVPVTAGNEDIKQVIFNENIVDKGSGWSAKLGVIVRPTSDLRVSASIHTPRLYKVRTSFSYDMTSSFDPGSSRAGVRQYNDEPSTYDYTVRTPLRINLGAGFVINRTFLINAELDMLDYSTMELGPAVDFTNENTDIIQNYKNTINVKLGFEYNLQDANNEDGNYRFRCGFASLGSPYNSNVTGIDDILKKPTSYYSLGFGYKEKNYYIDLSLGFTGKKFYYTPYYTDAPNYPYYSMENKSNSTQFVCTFGFNID